MDKIGAMKILLVHKFHRLIGGAEVFYFEVANTLRKKGHEVGFFSTESESNLPTEAALYTVSSPNYNEGSPLKRIYASRDIFYSGKKKTAMFDAIDEFQPDVIHAFAIHVHLTPSVLEAAKERDVPVVMSCNDYKHICPNYKLYDGKSICESCKGGHFYHSVLKRCAKGSLIFSAASMIEAYIHEYKKVYDRLVDRYLFSSNFMLEKTKEFWSEKDVSYGVLKNPFDVSNYTPIYEGEYVLYFGRIVDEKGVDRVVLAAQSTTMPIKIIGDGPELEPLQRYVLDHRLDHVEFLGPLWGDKLKEVLYGARFVVVPSLWHENFPYVIFQSFAAGKPVVGSRRGGIPELVGDDKGLLFEPNNVEELADCMTMMWSDDDLCRQMGRAARSYVETEFSEDAFYESLIASYRSVM